MFLAFGDKKPRVGANVFVDASARVIGDVILRDGVTVMPGSVIRAERGGIVIGAGSVVEDSCVLHVDADGMAIGEDVVIGHGAIAHCARIGARTLVGMGAIVLADAVIGSDCLIAAGALVPQGKRIPDGSLVMGVPGRIVRQTNEDDRAYIAEGAAFYRAWGEAARAGSLREVSPGTLGEQ